MSDHSFNPFIAKKYNINVAIFINNLIFWTRTNAASQSHYHEGRYWCYGTPAYFQNYFPYFTQKQIKYLIKQAIEFGLVVKGNFNKKGYDRTNWYSLSDKALLELNLDRTCLKPASELIGQICPMDQTNLSDLYQIQNTDTKKNNNNISSHISKNEQQKEGQKKEKNKSESTVSADTGIEKSSASIPDIPELPPDKSVEDCPTPVSLDTGQSLGGKIKLDEYVQIWNRLAGEIGCPLVLNNKRQRETIKRHLKCIALRWEQPLTPHNFEAWLKNSIALEYYLITKYLSRMDVCLRWHHFSESYERMMQELKKGREDD